MRQRFALSVREGPPCHISSQIQPEQEARLISSTRCDRAITRIRRCRSGKQPPTRHLLDPTSDASSRIGYYRRGLALAKQRPRTVDSFPSNSRTKNAGGKLRVLGIEPRTYGLKGRCSSAELHPRRRIADWDWGLPIGPVATQSRLHKPRTLRRKYHRARSRVKAGCLPRRQRWGGCAEIH